MEEFSVRGGLELSEIDVITVCLARVLTGVRSESPIFVNEKSRKRNEFGGEFCSKGCPGGGLCNSNVSRGNMAEVMTIRAN